MNRFKMSDLTPEERFIFEAWRFGPPKIKRVIELILLDDHDPEEAQRIAHLEMEALAQAEQQY